MIKINTGAEWDNISTIFSINSNLIFLTSDRVFTEQRSLTLLEMNEGYSTQTTHFLSEDWERAVHHATSVDNFTPVFCHGSGLVWERTTWIIPWGFARVGRTNQGIKNQCFCACYRTSADCTQPPLPVSLPGNQRLHLNTVDLHMHMLSIVTVPGQSMTGQYLVYYTFHIYNIFALYNWLPAYNTRKL